MKGRVAVLSLEARSLAVNPLGDPTLRPVVVYYPPGYDASAARYPVAYFLHGSSGKALNWVNTSGFGLSVPERIDALIAAGSIPPLLAVFVDGWSALGGSQWINSDAIGRYGDYLSQDVVAWADRTLRTWPREGSRLLIGHSSGGYGTLATTARTPGVFGHIACHAGDAYFDYCYLPDFPKAAGALLAAGGLKPWWDGMLRRARETKLRGDDHCVLNIIAMAAAYSPDAQSPMGIALPFEAETARVLPAIWNRWIESDPVRFVPKTLTAFQRLQTVFIDCGSRDEFHLRWGARMVAASLKEAGMAVVHEEFEDGHMGTSYRYDVSLKLIAPRLSVG